MDQSSSTPWYQAGLRFECTMCGNCCTGAPGFVWVNDTEVDDIADFLEVPREVFLAEYTREVDDKRSLIERANNDCIFYNRARGCTIYPVRPRQCRTWPFWESNLESEEKWKHTCEFCPGSGQGELIPVEEIVRRMKVINL